MGVCNKYSNVYCKNYLETNYKARPTTRVDFYLLRTAMVKAFLPFAYQQTHFWEENTLGGVGGGRFYLIFFLI